MLQKKKTGEQYKNFCNDLINATYIIIIALANRECAKTIKAELITL